MTNYGGCDYTKCHTLQLNPAMDIFLLYSVHSEEVLSLTGSTLASCLYDHFSCQEDIDKMKQLARSKRMTKGCNACLK